MGRYWVTIPPAAAGLPDSSVAEDDPTILSALEETNGQAVGPILSTGGERNVREPGEKRDTNVREPGEKRERSVREPGDNRGTSAEHPKPSPNPVPEAVPGPGPGPKEGSAGADPCRPAVNRSADVRAVFSHYRTYHPKVPPKPKSTSKEWRAVRARLEEGYSTEDLCEAIDGIHKTPYNLGANDRDGKYLGLELIMRTSDNVARFIENSRDPPRPRNDRERRTLEAAERFLEGLGHGPE